MTIAKRNRSVLAALASISLLAMSACSEDFETMEANKEPGSDSIAAMIAGNDDLSSVEAVLETAGLVGAFDAAPYYTVFAPTDNAMEALGDDFEGEEGRAALAAILREHVVPGYLTREDIANAIEANGGSVEMATMGNGTLTFSMDGDALRVAGTNGEDGAVIESEMLGTNGVVFPVDAVLKDVTLAE
ncbi:fasciclin domain-containing protein [Aurantiacibacter sp. D1-12]|uniref:fasciclin domain-containing protein n=1 Tax=Aurantiacibacter sp. D1-12 TaxID=2993658 RepID=UPI00237C647C|nr:fasciclin domain-containing protein [Aurantiacibacter sp. D1-12]MDE1466987.1 fasciclin domain-containing protein [Aurantiacibacter sp. D1-12]